MNNRRAKVTGLMMLALLLGVARDGHAQQLFHSQHALLAAAIQLGHAAGILGGPVAELFRHQFGAAAPLLVEATVIAPLARAGCKRIALVYRQRAAADDAGRGEATLKLELNYCLDGPPPAYVEQP